VKKEDDLIYNLIFSEQEDFIIDISDYIKDIYQYTEFVSLIKGVLKKAKVKISKTNIVMDSKTVLWELKVKK
jgi:hypothetical protein